MTFHNVGNKSQKSGKINTQVHSHWLKNIVWRTVTKYLYLITSHHCRHANKCQFCMLFATHRIIHIRKTAHAYFMCKSPGMSPSRSKVVKTWPARTDEWRNPIAVFMLPLFVLICECIPLHWCHIKKKKTKQNTMWNCFKLRGLLPIVDVNWAQLRWRDTFDVGPNATTHVRMPSNGRFVMLRSCAECALNGVISSDMWNISGWWSEVLLHSRKYVTSPQY